MMDLILEQFWKASMQILKSNHVIHWDWYKTSLKCAFHCTTKIVPIFMCIIYVYE